MNAQKRRENVEGVYAEADAFATDLKPVLDEIRETGAKTLQEIADELARRKIQGRRGGGWHPATVKRLLGRLDLTR